MKNKIDKNNNLLFLDSMAEFFTVEFPEVVIEMFVEVAAVDVVITDIVVVTELWFTTFKRQIK